MRKNILHILTVVALIIMLGGALSVSYSDDKSYRGGDGMMMKDGKKDGMMMRGEHKGMVRDMMIMLRDTMTIVKGLNHTPTDKEKEELSKMIEKMDEMIKKNEEMMKAWEEKKKDGAKDTKKKK
ncbi:MAG: hypothetical protein OEV59_09860 [Deltaproteobacteria bacterium]|nr:hypothetical protein [Deltaproteobacteria bacterium]